MGMRLGETDGIGRKQMLPIHESHLPPPVGQGQSSLGASAARMDGAGSQDSVQGKRALGPD